MRIAILACCVVLATACGEIRLNNKTLPLPPGTVVVQDVTKPLMHNKQPLPGRTVRLVYFNNSSGWDAIAMYYDEHLRAAGYTESLERMDLSTANPQGVEAIKASLRWYHRKGSPDIMLMRRADWGETDGPAGEFMLRVEFRE